jgi:hypothetical protein
MTAKYSAEWWEKLTAISAGAKRHGPVPTGSDPERAGFQQAESHGRGSLVRRRAESDKPAH